jgi:glucosamine--fructose-6-phosphate aminotransferase (isomerizing)
MAVRNLKRLEYRGYDSAGVAYPGSTGIEIVKAQGKIVNLENLLLSRASALVSVGHGSASIAPEPMPTVAVAHTRWATHGRPSEANAHPHRDCTGRLAVVHNGIIENYSSLRERLRQEGHEFASETDTEVIAHLVEAHLPSSDVDLQTFVVAARKAVAELEGSYAIAIVSVDVPDAVFVARKDSPLVIGLGEGENFLASDIPAVMAHTRRVITLEDGDCALITGDGVDISGIDGTPRFREPLQVDWDDAGAEMGGYAHFMRKEIDEGPRTVRDTLRGRILPNGLIHLDSLRRLMDTGRTFNRLHIVGCGTAFHAGLVGQMLLEQVLRTPVQATVASEFRYSDPLVDENTLVTLISQSGETADTLAALREARRRGAATLAIVNVVGSTLAREADAVIITQAGPEIGVASTKAYLAQLAAVGILAAWLGQERNVDPGTISALVNGLQALPGQIEQCLSMDQHIATIAEALQKHQSFFFLGRGYDFAASAEAALKLKEISYLHAEAYAAGEMKHGPLALVEPGVAIVGLCTQPATHDKMMSNLQEVKAREGTVLAVVAEGLEEPEGSDYVIRVPATIPSLQPVVTLAALQLLAYHVARLHGCSIDQPRNLAKSVTVE